MFSQMNLSQLHMPHLSIKKLHDKLKYSSNARNQLVDSCLSLSTFFFGSKTNARNSINLNILNSDMSFHTHNLLHVNSLNKSRWFTGQKYQCISKITFFSDDIRKASCFMKITLWRIGEDDQRGSEWESIKIPRINLVYIPNRTRHPSPLTRLGPHSYWIAIDSQNRVWNRSGNMNRC
jgi:hypothetical protein